MLSLITVEQGNKAKFTARLQALVLPAQRAISERESQVVRLAIRYRGSLLDGQHNVQKTVTNRSSTIW